MIEDDERGRQGKGKSIRSLIGEISEIRSGLEQPGMIFLLGGRGY